MIAGTLRVVVADDEPLARDNLRAALSAHADLEIVAECESGTEAVAAIREHRPHLVFLDVSMPALDGFQVVERIAELDLPGIIFVTAFDQHALRAFQVHAIDYLLKPFDDARLADALDHARQRVRGAPLGDVADRIADLLSVLGPARAMLPDVPPPSGTMASRFVVREDERAFIVRARDVDWFEADGNYVRLHVGGKTHRIRSTIRDLATQLRPSEFARIHRSTIVNLERVAELQPWFGGDYVAILRDGRQLRVSRTYAAALLRPVQ